MPTHEYPCVQPYISVSTESANRILHEFETGMRAIGHKIEDAFYNGKFASDCERHAWSFWLRANMYYHDAGHYLHGFNIHDRQRRNIERNKNLMDRFFYIKLRDQANISKYRKSKYYERCSERMTAEIDVCCEFLVVAYAVRKGVRRFASFDNLDLSEFPVVRFCMDDGRMGVRIKDIRKD